VGIGGGEVGERRDDDGKGDVTGESRVGEYKR